MAVEPTVSRSRPLWVAAAVTVGAAAFGRLPESVAGTAIGLWFLAATYWLVLRSRAPGVEREYGWGPIGEAFSRALRDGTPA